MVKLTVGRLKSLDPHTLHTTPHYLAPQWLLFYFLFASFQGGLNSELSDSFVVVVSQVTEVTMKLRHMQPYWVSLPGVLCSDRVATGTGAEDKCWNGMTRAR